MLEVYVDVSLKPLSGEKCRNHGMLFVVMAAVKEAITLSKLKLHLHAKHEVLSTKLNLIYISDFQVKLSLSFSFLLLPHSEKVNRF